MNLPKILKSNWGILILLLIFIFRYYDMLYGDNVFTAYGDYTYLICPVFSYVSNIFSEGFYPFWIKGMLGGTQIYDSTQFSITYPFYFFGIIDYGNPFETYQVINFVSLFHVLLLGINTYILARVLDISTIGSTIAAVIVIISSNTAIYSSWIMIISAYAWFPLFLAGLFLCFKNKSLIYGPIIAAIGFAGFIANPAQPIIHAVIVALPLVSIGLYRRKEDIKLILKKFSIAAGLGFGLSAVGIIPAIINYRHMIRWVGKPGAIRGYESLPIEAFEHELPFNTLINIFFDNGNWSHGPGHPYIGPIACILSVIGLVYIFKSKLKEYRWFLAVLSIIALYFLLSAYGNNLGLTKVNFYIPLINKIREPVRHLIIFVLVSSILSGFGYDILKDRLKAKHSIISNLRIYIPFLLILSFLCFQSRSNFFWIEINYLYLIVLGLLALFATFKFKTQTLPILILTLLFINSIVNKRGNIPNAKNWGINKEANLQSLEVLNRMKEENIVKPDERIIFQDKHLSNQKWSMNATSLGLRGFQTSFSPINASQFDQLHHCDWNYNYRSLLGAKWYIYNKDSIPEVKKLIKKYEFGKFDIYENPIAKPKIFIADKLKGYNGTKNHFFQLTRLDSLNSGTNYLETALFKDRRLLNKLDLTKCKNIVKDSIKIFEDSHNEVTANMTLKQHKIIVLNEFNNGDWNAYLDGNKVDIFNVNLNQIGIVVPCGNHEISFKYQPLLFYPLRILQFSTFIITCLLIFIKAF